jgi:hypothetical protein
VTTIHPLSAGQEALWLLHGIVADSTVFHGVAALRVHAALDGAALAAAIADTATRHPMLRSTWAEGEDGPVRLEHPDRLPPLEVRDVPGADDATLRKLVDEYALLPFDLGTEPSFRFLLLRPEPGSAILAVAAHHIAMDASAQVIVLRDVLVHYGDRAAGRVPALPPLPRTFDDYVALERASLDDGSAEFWRREFLPLPPSAELPADHPRPPRMDQSRTTWETMLPAEAAGGLDAAARGAGVTTFVYLFGLFQALLARWSGQHDFAVGYTVTTRVQPGFRSVVGLLANTPPYRARIAPSASLRDVIAATDRGIEAAVEHMAYPYALLPRLLGVPRTPDRPPLFGVQFNHLTSNHLGKVADSTDLGGPAARVGDLWVTPLPTTRLWLGNQDLTAEVVQIGAGAQLSVMYRTTLFQPATVERFAREYIELLRSARADLDMPVWPPDASGRDT